MTTFHELTHVYAGPMSRVLPLQAALGALGFRTEIAGEGMKRILRLRALSRAPLRTIGCNETGKAECTEPFATGCGAIGPLDANLLAPVDRAEETRRAIALLETEARRPSGEHPTVLEDLATLGRRIRWAACLGLTAPVGVVMGVRYMAESDGLVPRPAHHRFTVAAFFVCVLEVAAMGIGIVRLLAGR